MVLRDFPICHLNALEEICPRTSRTFVYLAVPTCAGHVCKSFGTEAVSERPELGIV